MTQLNIEGQPVEPPLGWDREYTVMGVRVREKTETRKIYRALYLGWKLSRPDGLELKENFNPEKETINRSKVGPKASTGIERDVRRKFSVLIEEPLEVEEEELQAGWEEVDTHTWRTTKAEIKLKAEALDKLVEMWKSDHRKAEGKARAFIQRNMKVLKDEVMNGGDWDLHYQVLLAVMLDHVKAALNQSVIDGGAVLELAARQLKAEGYDVSVSRV